MAGKSGQGTLILVLGILGFIGCGIITAIPAWIMGNNALKAIDSGEGDPNERQLVQVGRILGIVATVLSVLGILFWILFFGGMLALGASGAAGSR
jgi:hypothetical protein